MKYATTKKPLDVLKLDPDGGHPYYVDNPDLNPVEPKDPGTWTLHNTAIGKTHIFWTWTCAC